MNAGPDDLCIGWDRAINNGRLDVYDLLVELAEAGRVNSVASGRVHKACLYAIVCD